MTEKPGPPGGETLLANLIPADASGRIVVPPLACDSHMHVFGPPDRFPGVRSRSYAPRAAPLAAWRMAAGAVGVQRLVIVQPSVYGTDNACALEAVREAGEAARGIAAIDDMTPDAALHELDAAGFRGVRLNPKAVGARDTDALRRLIARTAARIAPLGWHVQLYAEPDQIAAIAGTIRTAPAPVVLDHMGGARAGDEATALRPVLDLLSAGRCWVKLSGAYRVSRQASRFDDSTPVARALVRANPEQLVWGSDWPHTASHGGRPRGDAPPIEFRDLDEAELLGLLAEAAGDRATFDRILVSNPARLYGW
jgi:predicted TIM-barrel fold metal-dependent hydrolase